MKNKLITLGVVCAIIVVLDQITKSLILQNFEYGETINVIANYFNITYVRNYGAAFGMLAKVEAGIRDTFFLLMPPFAMAVILLMLRLAENNETLRKLALCSVFAGALGNYIDRLRFGYVVDFLDFHIHQKYSWPAFNVADMAIVCGVTLLILMELFSPNQKTQTAK